MPAYGKSKPALASTYKGSILLNNVKITTYNSMKIEGKLFFFPSIHAIAYAFFSIYMQLFSLA